MPLEQKTAGCDCCEFETVVSGYRDRLAGHGEEEVFWLCEVCANTHLAIAVKYPSQCQDVRLYKAVGWIANRLLDEIRKQRMTVE